MRLPPGLAAVTGADGTAAFVAPELEAWVRTVVGRGERLHEAAARQADELLHGRGPVPVVTTSRGRWVVRRYRRGGRVAAPLLGDLYLRVGLARPLREVRASSEVRRRSIPTPRVMAGAVYPAGPFYRADLVTEFVADARDLARLLFGEERACADRARVLEGVGRLIARTAAAGIEHVDLNAKNVLVEDQTGGPTPLLLDLDRCRILTPGLGVEPGAMLARLIGSLRKQERHTRRIIAAEEWAALSRTARGAAEPVVTGGAG